MEIFMSGDNEFQNVVASAAREECTHIAAGDGVEFDAPVRETEAADDYLWRIREEELSAEPEDADLVLNFQQWLESPLVWGEEGGAYWCVSGTLDRFERFYTSPLGQAVTLRDALANDLSLWDGRPGHYLHCSEGCVLYLFHFSPDCLDWGRLRNVSRDEWHQTVHRYYELLHQDRFGPPGNGRCHHLALRHGYRSISNEIGRLRATWITGPNPLYWRRRRLYPHIDMNG
jgi:hypothetical protein